MRCFVDSNFIIYLVENSAFHTQIVEIVNDIRSIDGIYYSSVISKMEYEVKPYKDNNHASLKAYEMFNEYYDVHYCDITEEVADMAAKLRAKYSTKQMDSLQLATAICNNCDYFISNDFELQKIEEIKVICIEKYNNDLRNM